MKDVPGVKVIYDHHNIVTFGADPAAALMIEGEKGYYCTDETRRPAVVEEVTNEMLERGEVDRYKGTHGYHPDNDDYTTTLILNGPDIKAGQVLDLDVDLTDEGPTMAHLLNLRFQTSIAGHTIIVITAVLPIWLTSVAANNGFSATHVTAYWGLCQFHRNLSWRCVGTDTRRVG